MAAPLQPTITRRWPILLVVALTLLAWAAFLRPVHDRAYVYTWDSAAYVDCARSILEGRGLVQRTIDGLGTEIWEPISWWPPGYPLLIAAAASLGADLPAAGVVVAVLSAALAVMLLGLLITRVFGWTVAIPLVLTIVVMPAFLQISVVCMSDATYYALTVASALCLWNATQTSRAGLAWFFAAGLLAGLCWGVRNVAISLIGATAVFLAAATIVDRTRHRLLTLLAWGSGTALGLGPFAIRNVVTFGKLSGYHMPRSDLSVWQNISATAAVIVRDLTGSSRLEPLLQDGRTVAAIAATTLLLAVIAGFSLRIRWREFVQRHAVLLFCLAWAVMHLAVVIAARTTYRWGEPVVTRHTMQTYWLLFIALGLGLIVILQRWRWSDAGIRGALIALFALTAARQIQQSFAYVWTNAPHEAVSLERQFGQATVAYLAEQVRPEQIILAHHADLLRTHLDVNGRKLPAVDQYYKVAKVSRDDLQRHGNSGFLWGLVITDVAAVQLGAYDQLIRDMINRPEDFPEFSRVPLPGPAIVLKYNRAGPED